MKTENISKMILSMLKIGLNLETKVVITFTYDDFYGINCTFYVDVTLLIRCVDLAGRDGAQRG